jgi:hypothetical protein
MGLAGRSSVATKFSADAFVKVVDGLLEEMSSR